MKRPGSEPGPKRAAILAALLASMCLFTYARPLLSDEVEMVTGEVLKGEVIKETDNLIILQHEALGQLVIYKEQVKEHRPEPEVREGDTPVSAEEKAGEPPAEPAETEATSWDSRLEQGVNGSQGNSETFDYRAGLKTQYKIEEVRVKLDAAYFYGSKEDQISRNEYTVETINDWYFPDTRWSVFFQGRYDWNAFKEWRARVSASMGAGYKIIDENDTYLILRAGAGYFREYESEDEEIRPEGLLGIELNWKVSENQEIYFDTTYYPEFTGTGDSRILSNASWKADLDLADGLAITIGAKNEFTSDVEPDFKHNDFKYYGSIVLDF